MKKNNNLFWVSFSDIMTALFFIMLVLFVVSAAFFKKEIERSNVLEEQKQEIEAIQESLSSLDEEFFRFDEENKRYRLKVDVLFESNEADIQAAGEETLAKLEQAGESLHKSISRILEDSDNAHLLLIIEGNTQRYEDNYINYPDRGYKLSYDRSLALFNFWKDRDIEFDDFGERCEVIIAGSGYFGLSREEEESLNRRFTLQVTSKWTLGVD